MNIDTSLFKDLGIDVKDLMIAVTFHCSRRCIHCSLGNDWLDTDQYFDYDDLVDLVGTFSRSGLDRLSILGGEPFLYPWISDFILKIQDFPIKERRIVTSGWSLGYFDMNVVKPNYLNHISISFEGHTSNLHDQIRGIGTFRKAMHTMDKLRENGFKVFVVYTVTSHNLSSVCDAVAFFNKIGIEEINFHMVSLTGNAAIHKELLVQPAEWVTLFERLTRLNKINGIRLRIPKLFVTKEQYDLELARGYHNILLGSYKSPTAGHKILLYPNGRVYTSCDLTGTDYHLAYYEDKVFLPNPNENELTQWHKDMYHPSPAAILRRVDCNGFIPLSVSYKEIIQY